MIKRATPTASSDAAGPPAPRSATGTDRFVARQPIFDRMREVFGYELLFRSSLDNRYTAIDGDAATARVISDSLDVIGLRQLVGESVAFVNFTAQGLIDGDYKLLPPRSVVEVLEDVEPTEAVIAACREARNSGYVLALDDFVYRPGLEPLIALADIIKIDFMAHRTPAAREAFVHGLHRRKACLLAEKVETHEDFEQAMRLGYSYAQGFFFSKPQIIVGREIPGAKRTYLLFLAEVNRPDADFNQLERLVKGEVALSYKLLRYLNSAHFGLSGRIDSVKQALLLLGEKPLRKWASMIAVTSLAEDKPAELTRTTLTRASFCELCAEDLGMVGRKFDLFMLGVLSTIDAILDSPLHAVLNDIDLPFDVKAALLGSSTALGDLLALARACERADFDEAAHLVGALEISPTQVAEHHARAIRAADQLMT